MKKLFIVLAISSLGFVACNNEASTDTTNADSIRIADSTRAADSLAKVQADAAAADASAMEAKRVADSTAMADSLAKVKKTK